MKTVCVLKTGYDCESIKEVLNCTGTMTVGDMMRSLSWYDKDVDKDIPVVVKGKDGITYPFFALDEITEDYVD